MLIFVSNLRYEKQRTDQSSKTMSKAKEVYSQQVQYVCQNNSRRRKRCTSSRSDRLTALNVLHPSHPASGSRASFYTPMSLSSHNFVAKISVAAAASDSAFCHLSGLSFASEPLRRRASFAPLFPCQSSVPWYVIVFPFTSDVTSGNPACTPNQSRCVISCRRVCP
jgi:hypothetical protein